MQQIFLRTQTALNQREKEIRGDLAILAQEKGTHDSDGDNWDDPNVYEANSKIELLNSELNWVLSQIAGSIIIDPSGIDTSIVSQGTETSIKLNLSNSPADCFNIIVGNPLDSKFIKQVDGTPILSPETPILKSIIGKRVGEIVPYQHLNTSGTVEVLNISLSSLALES